MAGVPLTGIFNEHLLAIQQSDARNMEVQNRVDQALKTGKPGPSISFSGNEANPLFRNTGKGFAEIGTTLGISRTEDSRGFVLLDLDGDGALDVVMHNFYRNPIMALLNRAAGDNRWLRLKFRGTKSNRFGIGAQVTVTAEGRKQLQELHCGSGYQSCHPAELHYGLEKAEKADVTVRWPSGKVDEYKEVGANRVYTLVEGEPKAMISEALTPIAIEPDPVVPAPKEMDVQAVLAGLRTLGGEPSPVKASGKVPVLAIFASIECHVCKEEFMRSEEVERRAFEAGINLVWVVTDTNLQYVQEIFSAKTPPIRPLRPAAQVGSLPTPCVYLVSADRIDKFTGRFAVTAALEEASRPKK